MFGFLKRINPMAVFEMAAKGIDAAVYTNEEKAGFQKELMNKQLEYIQSTASENSIRSYSRRILAIGIMFLYLSLYLGSAIAYIFNQDLAKYWKTLAMEQNTLVLMVAGFFFGAYMIGTHINTKKK
jgi:hypothetical protein